MALIFHTPIFVVTIDCFNVSLDNLNGGIILNVWLTK